MSSEFAISVRDLGKRYVIHHNRERASSLGEALARRLRDPLSRAQREQFWALRHVSFNVKEGEIVGIVGRNGAGKSTILKILSRITPPTEGEVNLYGRTGSLLEVGTGFHRELTGRENIYLNGGILGMKRREIDKRFDEIVEFSGTARFLDTPVKRYSSGMFVRLAFAVAAHLDPEILIVDEVLAVGDADFQKKCLGKMQDVSRSGRTVLFVSHNMAMVQSLCHRCIWMENGEIRLDGPVNEVLSEYLGGAVTVQSEVDLTDHRGRPSRCDPIIKRIRFMNNSGSLSAGVLMGETMRIQILLDPRETMHLPQVGIGVSTTNAQRIFTLHTRFTQEELGPISRPTWVECELPNVPLTPGTYMIKVAAGDRGKDADEVEGAAAIEVLPNDFFSTGRLPTSAQGLVAQHSHWKTVQEALVESA